MGEGPETAPTCFPQGLACVISVPQKASVHSQVRLSQPQTPEEGSKPRPPCSPARPCHKPATPGLSPSWLVPAGLLCSLHAHGGRGCRRDGKWDLARALQREVIAAAVNHIRFSPSPFLLPLPFPTGAPPGYLSPHPTMHSSEDPPGAQAMPSWGLRAPAPGRGLGWAPSSDQEGRREVRSSAPHPAPSRIYRVTFGSPESRGAAPRAPESPRAREDRDRRPAAKQQVPGLRAGGGPGGWLGAGRLGRVEASAARRDAWPCAPLQALGVAESPG